MEVRILPAAQERLLQIWEYTFERWGDQEADDYVGGLVDALNILAAKRSAWKPLRNKVFEGVFFAVAEHR